MNGAYERALQHDVERHDAELEADAIFSHVEHQEPIRADVDAIPLHEAGPWSVWIDDDPDGEWEREWGWRQ